MDTRVVHTPQQAEELAKAILAMPTPFRLSWAEGATRSLQANALLHKWYAEIAKQRGDISAADVKGECHVAYGVPIRLRDPVWGRVWQKMCGDFTHEQQCFLFAQGILAMTRNMSTKELSEYMDAMQVHYRSQGIRLTQPEDDA